VTRIILSAAILLPALASTPCFAAQPEQVTAAVNPMKVDIHEFMSRIRLPEGFHIAVYAEGVAGARSMTLSKEGTLYVGTFGEFGQKPVGKVYALRDEDGDGQAERVITVARGLNYPNGVAMHDGDLYVAEISRILRFDDIDRNLDAPPAPVVVNDKLPTEYHHGWKNIEFGPDGKLYVPVGAPCNTCVPDDRHAGIFRMNPDGSELEAFARGIRNSVGMAWHPVTKELWFTDNGRDLWGDDRPPEELNHAPVAGLHFGFPYRYGKHLVDTTYPTTMSDADFTPAAVEFPAHNAMLGLRFYTGDMFPARYRGQLFIASHGSWNRGRPDGYRVTLVHFEDNAATGYEQFATGWLVGEKFWGRPVDVEMLDDGSLVVSDDFNGCIYRISYDGK
jgi:glucose/arabinose dehydrogenase